MKALVAKGFVALTGSEADQRVTHVSATAAGIATLVEIDADVRVHVDVFTRDLSRAQKAAALSIFAFYVGTRIAIVRDGES